MCVYVAFDGVPPMAKMQQQRLRRYKGQVKDHSNEGHRFRSSYLIRGIQLLLLREPHLWKNSTMGLIHHFRNASDKYALEFILSPKW